MSFDPKVQNARADAILLHFMEIIPIPQAAAFKAMAKTPGQIALMHKFARHVYAIAYQEGHENARTQP